MARSIRKVKIFGNGSGSEKRDKRINNRMFRRKEHELSTLIETELIGAQFLDFIEREISELDYPIDMDEVRNVWSMKKDGKHYWKGAEVKDMRK